MGLSLSEAPMLTLAHQDHDGHGTLVYCLFGYNIWIFWPSLTEAGRSRFLKIRFSERGARCRSILDHRITRPNGAVVNLRRRVRTRLVGVLGLEQVIVIRAWVDIFGVHFGVFLHHLQEQCRNLSVDPAVLCLYSIHARTEHYRRLVQ
jgi:hypothetical protein